MGSTLQVESALLDALAEGIVVIGLNGELLMCNRRAIELLDFPLAQAIGMPIWEHFSDTFFGFSLRQALEERSCPSSAMRLPLSKDREDRSIKIRATFCGPPLFLLLLIEDLTELSHQRDLAQRHSRLSDLGEMAALVAHEIRNPLGGIKGFASLLKRDLADRPELEKLASYILEATEGLSRLVNDILEYSQPVQLHKAPTDLVKLIEELLLHLNADESIDPRIELHSAGEAAILIAPVDAQALKLALLNLCTNAFHAMTDGGELCIACRRAPESCQAILTVSDSGPGIAPELLPKLFSPLFTTRSAGHGFGLTEVEKIIKAHGGTIGVISTPDAGTTFTIKLPLDTEE